jgi:mannose-6-phosphate isomerase
MMGKEAIPMRNQKEHDLYPLRFSVLPKEKVWGGDRIAELLGQGIPADRLIGEVWVVWDQLRVESGALAGKTLADLVRQDPLSILGSWLASDQDPEFPLLVKILDTREMLSVQVHPDDGYAQAHEGQPFGKAEVWYVLDAEPQSCLIHGVKKSLTRAEAKQAIETGHLQEVLDYVEVAPGDVILNAPGTIHALGGGILLYELQQSADLTYRLYDWDRGDPSRPLHLQESLDVARLEPFAAHKIEPIEVPEEGVTRTYLCACKHFAAELLTVRSCARERPAGVCFHVLTVLRGGGQLRYGSDSRRQAIIGPGGSWLIPAALDEYELQATGKEPLVLIKAYVPDLLDDVLIPLRQKGFSEETIIQLGGDAQSSDLRSLAH